MSVSYTHLDVYKRQVLTQFVQDFLHLEGGEDCFDENGRLDRSLRQADEFLGHDEDVVPQARFEMRFHFRQVEERAIAARDLLLCVVEKDQSEVENAAGNALAVDGYVLLIEVPAARTNLQRGDLFVERVFLAGFIGERELAADGLVQVDLTLDLVVPLRAEMCIRDRPTRGRSGRARRYRRNLPHLRRRCRGRSACD